MVLQFPASFANRLDEALRQNEALRRDLREENRRTEALDRENQHLRREIGDLREEIEGKNGEIQELRTKNEMLKIENKTAGLNLQDFSPSQVSLYIVIVHAQNINLSVYLILLPSQKLPHSDSSAPIIELFH
jgi:predicted nuclease with TOPRIM domain